MIGVVADDITGSNDIGIMFAKSSYITDIFNYQEWDLDSDVAKEKRDVLIMDTDSRFDHPDIAYKKVFEATIELQKAGAKQFYNKACSVFRGNVGIEFDAMLDAVEEEFAIVVFGFPKNGRTTIEGTHYVYDRKLEDSEFRNDPIHPMTKSNLVEILQSQTKRKVGLIDHKVIQEGSETLKSEIERLKGQYNYIILDVTEQADLQTIAKAVHNVKVICGSSALAEELPLFRTKKREDVVSINLPSNSNDKGLLCVAGSLMTKTADQIQYMREKGVVVLELESLQLFDRDKRTHLLHTLTDQIVAYMENGADVVLHSSNNFKKVEHTKTEGLMLGFTNKEISRLVSGSIANIVQMVIQRTGQNRLIVAGGDTSAAVCNKLGVSGMRVLEEIQPGLPSCVSHSTPVILLVLKSGSFGQPNFFEQAFAHLRQQ